MNVVGDNLHEDRLTTFWTGKTKISEMTYQEPKTSPNRDNLWYFLLFMLMMGREEEEDEEEVQVTERVTSWVYDKHLSLVLC